MTGRTREQTKTTSWLDLAGLVASIVAPLTVLSSLLVYVAWTRTKAFYDYFGVNATLLGLTPQDYLLRSADTGFGVLARISAASVVVLLLLKDPLGMMSESDYVLLAYAWHYVD